MTAQHTTQRPARRCLVSGESLPRAGLLRFAVAPDDSVVPDVAERLPGRGLWLTCRRDVVADAVASNVFRRAAKRAVTPATGPAGEDLAALVDTQLAARCRDALGLARRAGELVAGFDQVHAALKALGAQPGAGVAVLLGAHDAAADGRSKLAALAAHLAEAGVPLVQADLLSAQELGGAVGRSDLVHALVLPGAHGMRVAEALRRLAAYRGVDISLPQQMMNMVDEETVETD